MKYLLMLALACLPALAETQVYAVTSRMTAAALPGAVPYENYVMVWAVDDDVTVSDFDIVVVLRDVGGERFERRLVGVQWFGKSVSAAVAIPIGNALVVSVTARPLKAGAIKFAEVPRNGTN